MPAPEQEMLSGAESGFDPSLVTQLDREWCGEFDRSPGYLEGRCDNGITMRRVVRHRLAVEADIARRIFDEVHNDGTIDTDAAIKVYAAIKRALPRTKAPPMRADLLEMAGRVEAMDGADRELDCLVYAEVAGFDVEERDGGWIVAVPRAKGLSEQRIGLIDPGKHSRNFTPVHHDTPAYTASLDAAMSLAALVSAKWGRPHNLCIASAYGSAYIVPNDGASYGVNDPLKGDAHAQGSDEIGRTARAVTAACLKALAARSQPKENPHV